ncbi:MAG: hypothetical protein H6R15_1263 [Proteobacteria bacterium]|nr:hypothetical protein [Pseudomonadota bacterium]
MMKATTGLMSVGRAAELISAGKYLNIAGDEEALKQLPKGNWIGGTIPYFMADDGGVISRDRVFVNEIEVFGAAPSIRLLDVDSLPQICRNAPENGYTILVVPAFGPCHSSFAENAPNYEEMYMKPLIGWVAGVHLDDLGQRTPKVALGTTGELSDQHAVVIDVPLPAEKFARIDIVNLFKPGRGAAITFENTGFAAGDCRLGGQPANLADYLLAGKIDTRLPLVADYCGAAINVSIKAIDAAAKRVEFYAPVFPGVEYRIAEPLADYVSAFQSALPRIEGSITFSCNCILNFLYSELAGKRTGHITGPITFGEIAYQLLNQTLVYLTIEG